MAARGFLGAGDLYIERIVATVLQPRKGPYAATKFEIKPVANIKELISKGKSTYGQTLESVPLPGSQEFTVDLNEVDKEGLVLALAGTVSAGAQSAGTDTAATVAAAAVLGDWAQLAHKHYSGAVTVTNSGNTVTYVEGTDYIFNRALGYIKVPVTGSAIVAGQSLKYTATYLATTGSTIISGGTQSQLRARFILDGINQADGLPCIVTVYEGIIAATTAFDFLADDFNVLSLPGKMKTPTGFTSPFTVELHTVAEATS